MQIKNFSSMANYDMNNNNYNLNANKDNKEKYSLIIATALKDNKIG